MKTYVPKEDLNCPDGVSIFIENYVCSSGILNLTLKNNGKFDIGGYFIYATDSPEQELATIDLSKNNTDTNSKIPGSTGIKFGNLIVPGNTLAPDGEETEIYNLTGISNLYSIEILPIRWQKETNRNVLVSCKDTKIREVINCNIAGEECIAESTEETCGSAVCGTKMNNCGDNINCGASCDEGFFCDANGQCISSSCTPALNPCGSFICGTAQNGTCGAASCGTCDLPNALSSCPSGLSCVVDSCINNWCNSNGIASDGCEAQIGTDLNCASCGDVCTTGVERCVDGNCISILIGNGVCDSGETCAQEPACEGHQAACSSGYICISETCKSIQGGGTGCTNYCISLLKTPPYIDSSCTANNGQCTSALGYLESGGNSICTNHNPSYPKCCCFT